MTRCMTEFEELDTLANLLTVIESSAAWIARYPNDLTAVMTLRTTTQQASAIVHRLRRQVLKADVVEDVDVVRLVQRLQPSLVLMAGGSVTVNVTMKVDKLDVPLRVAPIERALQNLVSNARDAMGGIGRNEVEVSTIKAAGSDTLGNNLAPGVYALVAVRDQGPGFASISTPKLFEAFYTSKTVGTGLGLRQVLEVAQEHAGGVFVQSEPGLGATFAIALPLRAVS